MHRSRRIVATASNGRRKVVNYDSLDNGKLPDLEIHQLVAERLRDDFKWTGELIGGSTKHGYVFVFAPAKSDPIEPEGSLY